MLKFWNCPRAYLCSIFETIFGEYRHLYIFMKPLLDHYTEQ